LMMAQSLFMLLKREQPAVKIDVLVPTWCDGLLKRMPEVREVITHTIQHGQLAWNERRRIAQDLGSYEQAIVLPNAWKSALIPFWAKIPLRTGYRGEMRYGLLNDMRYLNQSILPRTVEQFVALGLPKSDLPISEQVPYPCLSPEKVEEAVLQRLGLDILRGPILALCPGAEYGPAKCWPLEYYAFCAKDYINKGGQVWVFGSHKDRAAGATIQSLAGDGCINLCGKTSLPEAVDLLALTQTVISNDSGLMHVAAALEKPLIALYGSSSPDKTPPLSSQAQMVSLGLDCSPCFQRTCAKKHLKCLRDIKPERVLDLI
jgi:heptosyltransferase II